MRKIMLLFMVLMLVSCTKEYTIEQVDNLEVENLTNNGQIIQDNIEEPNTFPKESVYWLTEDIMDYFLGGEYDEDKVNGVIIEWNDWDEILSYYIDGELMFQETIEEYTNRIIKIR